MTNLALAQNPNTPEEILSSLATDENSDVRYWIARNPNTPQETLNLLATDENSDVRYWIARNPNTPENIILKIKSYDKYEHLVIRK